MFRWCSLPRVQYNGVSYEKFSNSRTLFKEINTLMENTIQEKHWKTAVRGFYGSTGAAVHRVKRQTRTVNPR